MEKDFSNFGIPSQPKRVKMYFTERELDLLRMSVKGLYSHFKVHSELFGSFDSVASPLLSQLNDLYWKIFKEL